IDMLQVATGEHWYGKKAIELHLIDEIQTSDQYIQNHLKDWTVVSLKYTIKEKLADKLAHILGNSLVVAFNRITTQIHKNKV
ncbi:MAG TPA: S49 family peptidase, partial [Pseudobdellovibrionaceae bacterium]|nr:S49 family peptidase [Pseudobdellovibrionaceae bacterium]